MTTLVVAGADVHPFNVVVTVYIPLIATVALGLTGFCDVLVKPAGPDHEYVTPLTDEFADRFKVLPVHSGPLLPTDGDAGAEGFASVNGPIILELQPLSVTLIFEYTPAERLLITIAPLVFDVNETIVGLPPSLVY